MASRDLNDDENQRLRAAVRTLLDRPGVTQLNLAPGLGVGQSTLSGFLAGRQGSSYALARRVAGKLGIDVESMLSGEAIPASQATEVTLDRSTADAPSPADDETPLDRAIIHAWTAATMASADAYSVADMTNARAAARSISRLASADIDLEASARTYLEAARKVRKTGGTMRAADLVVAVRDEAMAMLLPVRRDVLEQMKLASASAAAKLAKQFESGTLPADQDPMARLRALEAEGQAREAAGIPAPIRVEPVHETKPGPASVGPGKKGRGK